MSNKMWEVENMMDVRIVLSSVLFPIKVNPAFSLGHNNIDKAANHKDALDLCAKALEQSSTSQIRIEELGR